MKFLFNLKNYRNFHCILNVIIAIILLTSCSATNSNNDSPAFNKMKGFDKILVQGEDFWITTYQKITDNTKPYIFYIEGDGRPFIGKRRISSNPTPTSKMFRNLVEIDARPNVIYVARPCQYTSVDMNPKCRDFSYWTNKRMSEDSVIAINEVINKINPKGKFFSIIGYSGGGAIAVLIAARNPNTKNIITIAGNLDHKAFTKYHGVINMDESLNPIDYAHIVRNIPQLHLSGGKDKKVPSFIAERYIKTANSNCVHHKIFPTFTHYDGWTNIWKEIYPMNIECY